MISVNIPGTILDHNIEINIIIITHLIDDSSCKLPYHPMKQHKFTYFSIKELRLLSI